MQSYDEELLETLYQNYKLSCAFANIIPMSKDQFLGIRDNYFKKDLTNKTEKVKVSRKGKRNEKIRK